MRARSVWIVGAAVGAIALSGLFVSAAAAPRPSESSMVITAYDSAAEDSDADWPVIAEVTLKCEPSGGSHIESGDACAALESVDGNFDALEPQWDVCTLIYQPVYVEVGGNWRDQVVSFEREYPNMCVAQSESEDVFQFTS